MDHDIVGSVQRFALPFIRQHGYCALMFVTDHAAIAVFASNLPSLKIEGVAVAVARRTAEDTHMTILFQPPHLAIIGNVAPEQITTYRVPGRAFGP
jgi:hypothetical protein